MIQSVWIGKILLSGMRVIVEVYFRLPLAGKDLWIRILGRVLLALGWRERVIRENLQRAFPLLDDSLHEKQGRIRQVKDAYRHLARLVMEGFYLLGPMKKLVAKSVDVTGFENWEVAHAKGKGVILLSCHVGNWEIMCASAQAHGMKLLMITKKIKPQWLHRAIERGRTRVGVQAAYEPRTLRAIQKQLREGETVGFILDQFTGPPEGVRVPLFGVPVGTHSVVATLAKRFDAPVVPVVTYRRPDGRTQIELFPAMPWIEGDEEIARNTAAYAAWIEKQIIAHPDQWLWMHKRFKGDLSPLRPGEWSAPRVRSGPPRE